MSTTISFPMAVALGEAWPLATNWFDVRRNDVGESEVYSACHIGGALLAVGKTSMEGSTARWTPAGEIWPELEGTKALCPKCHKMLSIHEVVAYHLAIGNNCVENSKRWNRRSVVGWLLTLPIYTNEPNPYETKQYKELETVPQPGEEVTV